MTEVFRLLAASWDVAKAKKITAGRTPNITVPVKPTAENWLGVAPVEVEEAERKQREEAKPGEVYHIRAGFVGVNREHAMSDKVDLSVPLLAVMVGKGKSRGMFIIDGWHRVYKAYRQGVESLPAIVLLAAEERACRLSGEW